MKFSIMAGVAALVVALSAATAIAQSTTSQTRDPSWTNEYNPSVKPPPFAQDSLGGASARKTPPGQQGAVGQYDSGQRGQPCAGEPGKQIGRIGKNTRRAPARGGTSRARQVVPIQFELRMARANRLVHLRIGDPIAGCAGW